MPTKKKVCILSHGRSGTVYTAEVLRAVGLDIGHELNGVDGAVGGVFWKGQRRILSRYDRILHQVRNPLDTISSLTTANWRTFEKYLVNLKFPACKMPANICEMSMLSWVLYTTWADSRAEWTFQVERLPEVFEKLCDCFGIERQPLPDLPQDLNSRPHETYTLADLEKVNTALAQVVHYKGILYGYWK